MLAKAPFWMIDSDRNEKLIENGGDIFDLKPRSESVAYMLLLFSENSSPLLRVQSLGLAVAY